MQEVIYIKLKELNTHQVELRYSHEGEFKYQSSIRSLNEIDHLIQGAESNYNTAFPGPLHSFGQILFRWLNGEDRFLESMIGRVKRTMRSQYLILAIDTDKRLAHLPWEVLHNGVNFLVESRNPTILPLRWIEGSEAILKADNRPLRVLFMATSPNSLSPVLNFEKEEELILTSTEKQKINLIVEESGNLDELEYLVSEYGKSCRFDIFHLTGHATLTQDGPRFYTETDIGDAHLASPQEIWNALPFSPQLIFLSGCYTGASGGQGMVMSLAHELIEYGASAVLGWGRPVLDDQATQSATILYNSLAKGHGLAMALSKTYQNLIALKYENWHFLRLFISGRIAGAFVTEPKRPGRQDVYFPKHGTTFLNQTKKRGEVANYKSFVGRRRMLQECIKVLKSQDYAGVLLWGMGGVGKSSIANRLTFRLRNIFKVILITDRYNNTLDIHKVRNCIADKIEERELRNLLLVNELPASKNMNKSYRIGIDEESFAYTLRDVLTQTQDRFLFVIDDFEGNFKKQSDGAILLSDHNQTPELLIEALETLNALTRSVLETTDKGHKIIITSRHLLNSSDAKNLYQLQVTRMESADVAKKIQRLQSNGYKLNLEKHNQLLKLSDGNPRLLEWLFKLFDQKFDVQLQSQLDVEQDRFREDLFIDQILIQLKEEDRQLLARVAIFKYPIVLSIVKQLCHDIVNLEQRIENTISLGLLEQISPLANEEEFQYSVSQIILKQLPQPDVKIIELGTKLIHEKWIAPIDNTVSYSPLQEARVKEVYRLAKTVSLPVPLIESARLLCDTWLSLGKNYSAIIELCNEVLKYNVDYQIYSYLASSLFETGECYTTNGEDLNGFDVLDLAIGVCPSEDLKAKTELLINYSFWLRDFGYINKSYEKAKEAQILSTNIDDLSVRVSAIHQYACINCTLGYFEKGEELFQKAKELSENLPPSERLSSVIIDTDAAHLLYWRNLNRRSTLKALEKNSKLFKESGALINYATTLQISASIYYHASKFKIAVDLCTQSLEFCKNSGSRRSVCYSLILAAMIDAALDNAGQAIEKFEATLESATDLGHLGLLGEASFQFGRFRLGRQEFDEAEKQLRNSLSYYEQTENIFGIANNYVELSNLAIARGEREEILSAIDVCLSIIPELQKLDSRPWIISILTQVGSSYKELEEYEDALEYYKKASNINTYLNSPGRSEAQYQLGQLHEFSEDWSSAISYYKESLSIHKRNDSPEHQILMLESLTNVFIKQESYEKAVKLSDEIIRIHRVINQNNSNLIRSLINKTELLHKISQFDNPTPELIEAESLVVLLDDSYEKAAFLDQIAILRLHLKDLQLSLNYWEQTHEILLKDYQRHHILTALAQLKIAYNFFELNQVEIAKKHVWKTYAILRTRLGEQHEIVLAIKNILKDSNDLSPVIKKWSLLTLIEMDHQFLIDKSAEVLHLLVGSDIVSVFDPDEDSQILNRIGKTRLSLLEEEDFLLPNIRIMDDINIPKRDYILQLNKKEIFRGKLRTLYAIQSPNDRQPSILNRKITNELGFPFPMLWIDEESQFSANTRVYSAEEIVMANLVTFIKQNKDKILAAIQ